MIQKIKGSLFSLCDICIFYENANVQIAVQKIYFRMSYSHKKKRNQKRTWCLEKEYGAQLVLSDTAHLDPVFWNVFAFYELILWY